MIPELEYGCIGRKLGHSYSVPVHAMLADYDYKLAPMEPEVLPEFMTQRKFKGINVTIPYKQDVIPHLYHIDPLAEKIGAVNTIVNKEGKLYGYNTDVFGLTMLLKSAGIELKDKKVLILGTGGTSKTAMEVSSIGGARQILKVSRSGSDEAVTYEQAEEEHSDAQVIINCTPMGMYPDKIGKTAIDIDKFPLLEGVADAVYNPLRSALVLKAEKKGIKAQGGLYMLVMQAVEAVKYFTGCDVSEEKAEKAYKSVLNEKRNIVLTGMPSAGKTTIGNALAKKLGKEFVDTDDLIVERENMPITDIFATKGEQYFRDVEAAVIKDLESKTGLIIATGGGSILRSENVDALKANGIIFFLDRPLEELIPTDSRPLSSSREAIEKRYNERYSIYNSTCDKKIIPAKDEYESADLIIGSL